jgi:hypothetical protein
MAALSAFGAIDTSPLRCSAARPRSRASDAVQAGAGAAVVCRGGIAVFEAVVVMTAVVRR